MLIVTVLAKMKILHYPAVLNLLQARGEHSSQSLVGTIQAPNDVVSQIRDALRQKQLESGFS